LLIATLETKKSNASRVYVAYLDNSERPEVQYEQPLGVKVEEWEDRSENWLWYKMKERGSRRSSEICWEDEGEGGEMHNVLVKTLGVL